MYKIGSLTPLQLKQKIVQTRCTKNNPPPLWEPTKSISVEGPFFINNLDSDQSKNTKNAFSFCKNTHPSSKAILFFAFQIDQNKHKGPVFQTALRFLPTKAPFHPKRVSLTEAGNTQYT